VGPYGRSKQPERLMGRCPRLSRTRGSVRHADDMSVPFAEAFT
jgi:hypothetical protein